MIMNFFIKKYLYFVWKNKRKAEIMKTFKEYKRIHFFIPFLQFSNNNLI